MTPKSPEQRRLERLARNPHEALTYDLSHPFSFRTVSKIGPREFGMNRKHNGRRR